MLNYERISAAVSALAPSGALHLLSSVDSTNSYAKRLARQGSPHGTVVLAEEQTMGRGRAGRQFSSPKGLGLYASFLLRPNMEPQRLLHVTAMAAVAACRAVEHSCPAAPQIKWTNDLMLGGKKLGGVLTEFSSQALIIGIGVNVHHRAEDFPPEIAPIATSLFLNTGCPLSRTALACSLIDEVCQMSEKILLKKEEYLRQYEHLCLTVGQDIILHRGGELIKAHCTGLDGEGALLVRYADGSIGVISAGDVSVRGPHGYI
jgi:BirA family biotin operon repressor/biotin-[acetyl-CoA-carboxylase] ligase